MSPCDDGEVIQHTSSGQGVPGIDEKLDAIGRAIVTIWDKVKCDCDAIAAIPEWWQVRVGANRPQLVVLYAEKQDDGKLGRTRWPVTIPWFNPRYRSQLKTRLPKYRKGQHQGLLVLNDNSKILVYAYTQVEAETVVKRLADLVQANQRPKPLAIAIGQRKGTPLKTVSVVPTIAHFYADGQQSAAPTWSEKLT
ncbi:MAG: hypothetical protein HC929_16205 [Leptolyngbyaceae cyanobacterium SM2_5_2]|nr:hypothetical protein [Leptolyngbyaceae cyanobacterium SM2_5_2]